MARKKKAVGVITKFVSGDFSVLTTTLGEINETDKAKERRQNQWEFYVGNMHMNGADRQSLSLSLPTNETK